MGTDYLLSFSMSSMPELLEPWKEHVYDSASNNFTDKPCGNLNIVIA